jgi:hypothetical protein
MAAASSIPTGCTLYSPCRPGHCLAVARSTFHCHPPHPATTMLARVGTMLALAAVVHADEAADFFGLTAYDITGQPQSFEQYRGNVVLVVNVATD